MCLLHERLSACIHSVHVYLFMHVCLCIFLCNELSYLGFCSCCDSVVIVVLCVVFALMFSF